FFAQGRTGFDAVRCAFHSCSKRMLGRCGRGVAFPLLREPLISDRVIKGNGRILIIAKNALYTIVPNPNCFCPAPRRSAAVSESLMTRDCSSQKAVMEGSLLKCQIVAGTEN